MNLVVVESPSKAKTINKYLGKDYLVVASKGHIVDLPKSKIGIYPEKDFEADFVVTNKKQLDEIKSLYKKCSRLILALDMDREGEAIAWHIHEQLKNIKSKSKQTIRIVFNEISKKAILDALNNPREINLNLVNAQLGRRFLDRLVGYTLSPLLWKKIFFGLSAGRVQSVALRLVVEREELRMNFKEQEYWKIAIELQQDFNNQPYIKYEYKVKPNNDLDNSSNEKESIIDVDNSEDVLNLNDLYSKQELVKKNTYFILFSINNENPFLDSEQKCKEILYKIKDKQLKIADIIQKTKKLYPKPPFITSTLQQYANSLLGFSSKKTMQIAQKLYELGYITYMRTDSVNMSEESIKVIRNFIIKKYGNKFCPQDKVVYKSKSKNIQEAHECIRPVDIFLDYKNVNLSSDEILLYELILKRTLQSQMSPAEFNIITYIAEVNNLKFKNVNSFIIFPGFLIVNQQTNENIDRNVNDDDIFNTQSSKFSKNQILFLKSFFAKQSFTQPPSRYSESTLIKKMEELEIGRPSTYSSIISTIISRKYVEFENKYLKPTDLGFVITKFLKLYFPDIIDYSFTAEMENKLDMIAKGQVDWKKMLNDFYFPFKNKVDNVNNVIVKSDLTVLGESSEKCPICGDSNMQIKLGRYGKFLSCKKYPECKGILPFINKNNTDNIIFDGEMYEDPVQTEDGRKYILKKGKYGYFWAHPDYPNVKDVKPVVFSEKYIKENFGTIPVTEDGRKYILKKGKYGYFWAHPDYPNVKDIKRIKLKIKTML